MLDSLTPDQVRHVAGLSRLKLSGAEAADMAARLSQVLHYVSKLNELDVAGVEPMAHPLDVSNVLRDDAARPPLSVETALANAPDKSPPFFKVPKVIGEGSGA